MSEKFEKEIKSAEIALINGEYSYCVEILNPNLEFFPVSSKKGVQLRMMLITALSGGNKNEEAIIICKQLLKSKHRNVREEAKSLIQILSSPNLIIPETWNVQFENLPKERTNNSKISKNIKQLKKGNNFINTSNIPTGDTKPFQKGFIVLTLILLIALIPLLSGCVKIENTLDIRELDSINLELSIESKYLNKLSWQKNFENKIQEISPNAQIIVKNGNFSLIEKGNDLEKTTSLINNILEVASYSSESNSDEIKINHLEKNFLIGKKYFFDINLDLTQLESKDNIGINFNIINPAKPKILNSNGQILIDKKIIFWKLIPGTLNQVEFSYWEWNSLLITSLGVISLVFLAYILRQRRYTIGTSLPQLPS